MAIREFFSQRKANAANAGKAEVFQYENVPQPFRAKVLHLLHRTVGVNSEAEKVWRHLRVRLAEDHGLLDLPERYDAHEHYATWAAYFYEHSEADKALDAIEQVFTMINLGIRPLVGDPRHPWLGDADEAISDLNTRFREYSIGYEFNADANQIVRVDSQYMHAEAVKPALHLLNAKAFKGPQDEFLRAHKHYREGDYKAAVNEALKALESTLKTICEARGWKYGEKATAIPLIDTVLTNGLVPSYHEKGLKGLRGVLEGMGPTTRNQSTSSHGQGAELVEVPEHLAAYVLHGTAENIVFLIESHRALG